VRRSCVCRPPARRAPAKRSDGNATQDLDSGSRDGDSPGDLPAPGRGRRSTRVGATPDGCKRASGSAATPRSLSSTAWRRASEPEGYRPEAHRPHRRFKGVFLCFVIGIGGLVLPLMAGAPPPPDLGSSPRETWKAVGYLVLGPAVLASLVAEQLGATRAGPIARGTAVAIGLGWGGLRRRHARLPEPPRNRRGGPRLAPLGRGARRRNPPRARRPPRRRPEHGLLRAPRLGSRAVDSGLGSLARVPGAASRPALSGAQPWPASYGPR